MACCVSYPVRVGAGTGANGTVVVVMISAGARAPGARARDGPQALDGVEFGGAVASKAPIKSASSSSSDDNDNTGALPATPVRRDTTHTRGEGGREGAYCDDGEP